MERSPLMTFILLLCVFAVSNARYYQDNNGRMLRQPKYTFASKNNAYGRAYQYDSEDDEDESESDEEDPTIHLTIINHQENVLPQHGDNHLHYHSAGGHGVVKHPVKKWGYDADHDGSVSPEEEACGKIVDANGNGQIDLDEKKAFIACLKGATGAYDGPDADSTVSQKELQCGVKADKNGNGKIDADEIAEFEHCLGIKPFDANHDGNVSPEEEACGKIVDQNGNGIIDLDEKKAFIACLKGAAGAYDGPDADSTVSQKELECGVKADANSDGKISDEEIAAFEKCLGITHEPEHKPQPKPHPKPHSKPKTAMNGFDADGDGKISPAEKMCAEKNDANHNGKIDDEEMVHFLACLKGAAGGYDGPDDDKTVSMSELKCGIAVDKNGNGQIDADEIEAFESCLGISQNHKTGTGYDFDGDKVVSKEEQACAMIVDANGNGKIDETERKAMIQCLKGAKGDYDQNKDGSLTPKELKCAMQTDKNKNGKIDANEVFEFEVCLGLKNGYDKNGDGVVSKEEMACGKIADANGNGKLDKEEEAAFIACLEGAIDDHDGKEDEVTPAELRCGLQADVNHDGEIDESEMAELEACLTNVAMLDALSEENPHAKRGAGAAPLPADTKKAFNKLFDCDADGNLDADEMARASTAWQLAQSKAHQSYYDALTGYYGYYGDYADDGEYYYDGDYYYGDEGYYDDYGDYYGDDDEKDYYYY